MHSFVKFLVVVVSMAATALCGAAQNPDSLLLKNYRPKSIYKTPVTRIEKAKFPVIDMHSHEFYIKSKDGIPAWIKTMDKFGIVKSIVMTAETGKKFDSIYAIFAAYGDRFEVWCGFDYTGYDKPGWGESAVKELERCYKVGAKGVGELGDKGFGEFYSGPVPAIGMHVDDPRMTALFQKCAELKMPVNIHVAEPMWMYEPMDSTNDGLMNAYEWRIDKSRPGLIGHQELVNTLENVVRQNPNTTFISCHLANCEYDLTIIGNLLAKYKNLYADIGARFAEIAPIPRYMNAFFQRYQDKILYGTDMHPDPEMYEMTFRILETQDEHFYEVERTGYHFPLYGFGLPDAILKKVYNANAKKILGHK